MHFVSNGIQDQLLLLLDIFPSLGMSEKNQKSDNSQFPIILKVVKNFSANCVFWITVWRANNEQSNFFGTESTLKDLPLTSKAASGYFGQSVWNWIEGNVPRFGNTNNKGLT